jgi:hypothetical protein
MLLIVLGPSSYSLDAPMEVDKVFALPKIYMTEAACLNDTIDREDPANIVYDCIEIKREQR